MARRKINRGCDRTMKKPLISFYSDMEEDDNKGGENHEQGCLLGGTDDGDDDYPSSSYFVVDDDDHEEDDQGRYSWYTNYGFQEAIYSSYSRITNIQEYEDDDHHDSPKTLDVKQKGICKSHPLKPLFAAPSSWLSTTERGECSWSTCVICGDDKPSGALKKNEDCGHCFCEDCMRVYVAQKIQGNTGIYKKIKCPQQKCNKHLGIQQFGSYIPEEVYERIVDARREGKVLANPRFIECPLLFCSAKFVDDKKGFKIKACPGCWRIFCVECGVKWHMGKSCEQFQAEVRARAQAEARARARAEILMSYRLQVLEDFEPLLFR